MLLHNLEILKAEYPEIYREIINIHENVTNQIGKEFEYIYNRNNTGNLIIYKDGKKRSLHSRFDPIGEAEKWVNQIKMSIEDTIIIFGLGLGYYLYSLKERFPEKNIIIIEPNVEIFYFALQTIDFSPYLTDQKIAFIVSPNISMLDQLFIDLFSMEKIGLFNYYEVPSYSNIFSEISNEIRTQLLKFVYSVRGNNNTGIIFAKQWVINTLRNLKFITNHNSVKQLKKFFQGMPIIIVSAGPSLEKNVHQLKSVVDKALIIGVGSAVNILEKYGITPHLIMGIDGSEKEAELFARLKNQSPILLYGHTIHYRSLVEYTGNKMWFVFAQEAALSNILEEAEISHTIFQSGPSVANVALDLANWLNPSVIILIGQDLAYTNSKLYANGAIHAQEISIHRNETSFIQTEDIFGNPIYTSKSFIIMRNWFERYVAAYSKGNIYNCSEGGIPIKGIPNMALEVAISNFCNKTYNIAELIEKALNEPLDKNIYKINDLLSEYLIEIKDLIQKSEDRLLLITEILGDSTDINNLQLDKIIEITEQIETNNFFKNWIYPHIKEFTWTITQGIHLQVESVHDIDERKKMYMKGMLKNYVFTHEVMLIVKDALKTYMD